MPMLGFTVFKDKILDGSKTQTIRKFRKTPIKANDKLFLYWHPRQKDCEKLGEAICSEVFTIRIIQEYWLGKQRLRIDRLSKSSPDKNGWIALWITLSIEKTADIIQRDGFKDADEMLAWFSKYPLPEVFQVIRWNGLISNTANRKEPT